MILIISLAEFKLFKSLNSDLPYRESIPNHFPCFLYIGGSTPAYQYLYKHNVENLLDALK